MENVSLQDLVTLLADALQKSQSTCDHTIGLQFENYNEEAESWKTFIQRLENYFALRDLTGNTDEILQKKRELLLHTMGTKTLQLLGNLTSPEEPNQKTYDELVNLVQEHLSPKPSEIAEQNRFSKCVQNEGESISNFITDLKKLSKDCNFMCPHCNTSTVDIHLRQQFISGVRNPILLERLIQLKSPENKFKNCVDLALAMETAQKESREIQNNSSSINQVHANAANKNTFGKRPNFSNDPTRAKANFQVRFSKDEKMCYRCGNKFHLANKCYHKDTICKNCYKRGHIAKVCCGGRKFNLPKSTNAQKINSNFEDQISRNDYTNSKAVKMSEMKSLSANCNSEINFAENKQYDDDIYMNCLQILPESTNRPGKIMLNCKMDGAVTNFEFDTGATVTSISEKEFRKLLPEKEIHKTELQLRTYTGEIIRPIGYATVEIQYGTQSAIGNVYIMPGNVDAVLGREWLQKVKVDLTNVLQLTNRTVDPNSKLQKLISEFPTLFSSGVGRIPDYKGKLMLKENTKAVFRQPRQIPFALKNRVLAEIDRLEENGVITKITYSEWGTPLVPIVKRDGTVRLCADYKCTVNPNLQDDHFPIPNIEEIFATMAGGKYFTSLDLSQAYLNMEMDENSAMIQAISTPKGVYKVNRLMFGIKVAPAIWQRFMTQLLDGIPGVCVFYDDIKIQGSTMAEHFERLRLVFQRLQKADLRINEGKSQFCKESITYLGHVIDKNGLSKTPDKVQAVLQAPQPKNIAELRSWLGLVNYYGKFFKNLSSKLHPLYKLLQKDEKFLWKKEQEDAFQLIKQEVTSDEILVAYDPELPLLLSTDASPYGIGAVLSHVMPDKSERPIAYASRSLTSAEKNYSQINKEATGIYWGVQRFFQYLYGKKFTLVTDHKPLVSIFSPDKQLPVLSAQRMLHYAQFLQGFNYTIQYRNTKEHGNADALSRLPLLSTGSTTEDFCQLQLNPITDVPVTHAKIVKETANDPILRNVYQKLTIGAPLETPGFEKRDVEFSIEEGCILRGSRIVIPTVLRKSILNELHLGHIGIVKMKALGRSYVWWPNIDKDIEEVARNCRSCCLSRNIAPKGTVHPWEFPSSPWQRIHLDYAGPFKNKMFLMCVDAFSKWPEVVIMNSTTSEKTIDALHEIFSRHGLPVTLVTDNGSQFTSQEFNDFVRKNGIFHKLIPAYHPSSNGQAERYVATIKSALRKSMEESGPLNLKLANFLLHYRKTPNASTGVSPCELLMKRNIRTLIDLVRPNLVQNMQEKNFTTVKNFRQFEVGEKVQARNYNDKDVRWKFGKIVRREGLMNYWISVEGQLWKRHVDQLLKCSELLPLDREVQIIPIPTNSRNESHENIPTISDSSENSPVLPNSTCEKTSTPTPLPKSTTEGMSATLPSDSHRNSLRRSARVRKPVNRLNYT